MSDAFGTVWYGDDTPEVWVDAPDDADYQSAYDDQFCRTCRNDRTRAYTAQRRATDTEFAERRRRYNREYRARLADAILGDDQ